MNESPYDFLIDQAIDNGDFESAKHWVDLKYTKNNKAVLAEDLDERFGVLIDGEIRPITKYNLDRLMDGTIVEIPRFSAKGSIVEFHELNLYEKIMLFGYITGKYYGSITFFKK